MKKRVIVFVLCLLLVGVLCLPVLVGCTPRDQILKVYNWADYISNGEDDSVNVIQGFEDYYKEVTGKKIKVKYDTFDTNETMLNKIVGSNSDYDVVCPSDYIIEKMRKDNLLIEKVADLGVDVNGSQIVDYRALVSDLYKKDAAGTPREFDPEYKYSVGYMWGTMGVAYNAALLSDADKADANNNGHPDYIESWSSLFSANKYADKTLMKDSLRDTMAAASLFVNTAAINAGTMTVVDAINNTSDDNLSAITNALKTQKKLASFMGYETDEGKQRFVDGDVAMMLQWGGDAFWSISEAALNNVILDYYIPNEGSNLFFDGWVIPKYSKNQTAAQLWLNYMCNPDVSIANMDYIGYTSIISSTEVIDHLNSTYTDFDAIDLTYIFGNLPGANNVKVDQRQYPGLTAIQRCAVMKDFGERNSAVISAWSAVKAA